MKSPVRGGEPTTLIHHVKEIRMRLLVTVLVLIVGMVVGYFFYEPLFQLIKAPLNGPLHYTSPSGSFSFVIKICLMVGVITALPIAVYNVIMFVQPALKEKLSKTRIYVTTFFSLLLASAGGAFAFLIIIPMALKFFYKFQVDGLVALISADDYLRFVVNVIITFVLIFQLPLLMSLADHIKPIPPKKLLKAEKYIIIGSVAIAVVVPFALDPTVQLLIASPIIILYNISIGVIVLQHYLKRQHTHKDTVPIRPIEPERQDAIVEEPISLTRIVESARSQVVATPLSPMRPGTVQSRQHMRTGSASSLPPKRITRPAQSSVRLPERSTPRLISDIRPTRRTA